MKKYLILVIALMFVGCWGGSQQEEIADLKTEVKAIRLALIEAETERIMKGAEGTAADQKLSALASTAPYEAVPANADLMYFVDVTGNTSHSITVAYLMSYLSTNTAVITGGALTPLSGTAADFDDNFTGANLYGGTYRVTTHGTAILPEPAVGMNFSIEIETAAGATVIDPLGTGTADTIRMNGLLAAADENITSSTVGAMCVFQYAAANVWQARCNGFTEATPP